MMIDPPIDKLIEKVGCRYTAACAVAQRARMITSIDGEREDLEKSGMTAISYAAKQIYDGSVKITD